jgi:hypothetical protein
MFAPVLLSEGEQLSSSSTQERVRERNLRLDVLVPRRLGGRFTGR